MEEEKMNMDEAAEEAEQELKQLQPEQILPIARWWQKWYTKAGHKRLGRAILKKLKELN